MRADSSSLSFALVGHTNAGKTSLMRTLTRRADFGEVSSQPGTTRHIEALLLKAGPQALRFLDTPGLEDAPALLDYLQELDASLSREQRLQAFLGGPAAEGDFEQEAKVLRCLLEVDAALLVIDARETPLPKFESEIEALMLCAKPLMPVLNFVQSAASQEPAWRRLLAAHGLHAYVRFDAVAPFVGSEQHLYSDLGALLPERRQALQAVATHLRQEADARHLASLRLLAEMLLSLVATREELDKPSQADPQIRAARIQAFRGRVAARSLQGLQALLALHGFAPDSAEVAELPQLAGRWEADLFEPEALKDAGQRLGRGAAIGGAIGLGLDVALAGLSLGAATSVGAAVGGVLSQGGGLVGRRLLHKLRGSIDLSLEDSALLLLARQHLSLLAGLEQRGHAALGVLRTELGLWLDAQQSAALLAALAAARSHPEWAEVSVAAAQNKLRQKHLQALLAQLQALAGEAPQR